MWWRYRRRKNSSSLIWSKSTTKADRSEFTVLSRRSEMREANYRRTANDVSESNRPQTVHDDDICPSAWQLTAGQWSVRVTGQASAADRRPMRLVTKTRTKRRSKEKPVNGRKSQKRRASGSLGLLYSTLLPWPPVMRGYTVKTTLWRNGTTSRVVRTPYVRRTDLHWSDLIGDTLLTTVDKKLGYCWQYLRKRRAESVRTLQLYLQSAVSIRQNVSVYDTIYAFLPMTFIATF